MTDLIGRVADAGFQVVVRDGNPALVPVIRGATMPPELMAELKANRAAVIAALSKVVCPVCDRDVSDPEYRERMVDALFCENGGGKGATDSEGVYHPAVPRCPYKPDRREG